MQSFSARWADDTYDVYKRKFQNLSGDDSKSCNAFEAVLEPSTLHPPPVGTTPHYGIGFSCSLFLINGASIVFQETIYNYGVSLYVFGKRIVLCHDIGNCC